MQINDNDYLHLAKQSRLTSQLDKKQKIAFSTDVNKFNDVNKPQHRIIMITNTYIYYIQKSQNFLKAMISKIVTFDKKFTIKKKIQLKDIQAVTLSSDQQNFQMVLHIIKQCDQRFQIIQTNNKKIFLKILCQQFEKVTGKKMKFFFKNDVTLEQYCTQKADLKAKISRMPKQNPVYLNVQDLSDYEPQGTKFQLLYSHNGQKIDISKFISSSLQQVKQNQQYFSIQSKSINFQHIKNNLQNKHQFINLPYYVYKATENLYTLRPFMIGGKMDKLIKSKGAFSKEICIFYIAQLILVLQFLHSKGWTYRAMSLSNIYIKENGYISIDGLNKLMKKKSKEGEMFYDICGLPEDLAPEMILCEGYDESVDVWGLGLCAYNMLQAHHPFTCYNVKQTLRTVLQKKIQPQSLPSFIYKCFQKNPILRPSLSQIKKDPCFNEINWKAIQNQEMISPIIPEISSVYQWQGKLPSIVQLKIDKK